MKLIENCPKLGQKVLDSEQLAQLNEENTETVAYLAEKSGIPFTSAREATKVLDNLRVQVFKKNVAS